MNKKLSSTSIMKQLPKENIYNNIKSPLDLLKTTSNTELNTQVKNFQKRTQYKFYE